MKEQLAALYELQRLDVRIHALNHAMSALDGAKCLRKEYAAAKALLDAEEKVLAETESELKDRELALKTVDEKRATYEKRLYGGTVSNPKELAAMEKEVALLKTQQSQHDGRVLELYDLVEGLRGKVHAASTRTESLQEQVKAKLAEEEAERARIEDELKELASQREEAVGKIADRSLLARYEAMIRQSHGTGIARVVEGKCECCRVSVTGFTLRKLFEDKNYESCENCGRILYLEPQ